MTAVECMGLERSYGQLDAVKAVSFSMDDGEFLALLGPNGAGKSTLLHMLITLIAPSRGEARVVGADIRREPERVRAGIGVVFQDPALDERMTARENLRIHAALYRLPARRMAEAVERALTWAKLEPAADRPVRTFSGGMKRRLELARALMHEPRLLVLDEPTIGLDPQGRRDLWERIAELRRGGMSVLMATHALQEAEACSRVGIIDRGNMVAIGTPVEIGLRALGRADVSLEDVFVELTGRGLRDTEASPRDRILAFRKQGGEHTR
jgi:ABC-2 type transport system ATP-binding protein